MGTSPSALQSRHQLTFLQRNAQRVRITALLFVTLFLMYPSTFIAQYRQIFNSDIPQISKMLVFDDTLFGCSGSQRGNSGPFLYSIDGGASWQTYFSPLSWLDAEVTDIAVEDSLLYVLTDHGLFRKSLREKAFFWVTQTADNAYGANRTQSFAAGAGQTLRARRVAPLRGNPLRNLGIRRSRGDLGRSLPPFRGI